MLHVLLHMARHDAPFTSEQISKMLGTNPVVVRRTMSGLKKSGFVVSEKGHGGGWKLSCDLDAVTLLDIHQAVGGPHIFAIGNTSPNPACAVEKVVNAALDEALAEAEALLVKRLASVTLGHLAKDFDVLCNGGEQTGHETQSGSTAKRIRIRST